MWNWLRKRLGYHVCEEFTRWETVERTFERLIGPGDGNMYLAGVKTWSFVKKYQQRQCTICGKIEQEELEV